MTVQALRDRLDAILTKNPELGSQIVLLRSKRKVTDKRKRTGYRYEESYHTVNNVCGGTLGIDDMRVTELMGGPHKDWKSL